jgi:hypothetical protein
MKLHNDMGNRPIKDVIEAHPAIGEILNRYEIGCLACTIGTCYLKDVVAVHVLGEAIEAMIEKEINAYLESL